MQYLRLDIDGRELRVALEDSKNDSTVVKYLLKRVASLENAVLEQARCYATLESQFKNTNNVNCWDNKNTNTNKNNNDVYTDFERDRLSFKDK